MWRKTLGSSAEYEKQAPGRRWRRDPRRGRVQAGSGSRCRPGHRTAGRRDMTGRDTTFPNPEAAPLRISAKAALTVPARGSGFCDVNSPALRGRRRTLADRQPPPGAGGALPRSGDRAGAGGAASHGQAGVPAPRRGVYAAGSCGSAVNLALTAGTRSHPARRRLPQKDGQTGAGVGHLHCRTARVGGRAALPPQSCLWCVWALFFRPPAGKLRGSRIHRHGYFRGERRAAAGPPSPPGTALPHRLLPSPPFRQSPPSVGGWAPAAGYLASGVDAQLLQLLGPRRGAQLRLLPRGARRAWPPRALGGAPGRAPGCRGALLRPAARRPGTARLRHARGAAAAARPAGRHGAPGPRPSPSPRRRRLLPGGAGGGIRRSAGGSCPAGRGLGGPTPASRCCAPRGERPRPCAGAGGALRPRGEGGGGTRCVREAATEPSRPSGRLRGKLP